MNGYQETLTIKLKVLGPVFVGSGRELSKKEYIFLNKSEIGVLDFPKFYNYIVSKGLSDRFETFLVNDERGELYKWLYNYKIRIDDIKQYFKYIMPCGDTSLTKGNKTQIMEFVKDPYGKPYIPGSSMKGVLRNLLLNENISDDRTGFNAFKKNVKYTLDNNTNKKNKRLLSREDKELNVKVFNNLEREQKKIDDARNDELAGLIVGDSKPLEITDLILVQKIERETDGTERNLNLLREALKPTTLVEFPLTIDTQLCKINKDRIMNSVKTFSQVYNECFVRKFKGFGDIKEDIMYLGGGSGFTSKTVNYTLFGSEEGTEINRAVFDNTGVPSNHKHNLDIQKGVSPHILKCTRWDGKLYQMGKCRISIE